MISLADKFLIDEGFFSWTRNSISNVLGRRQLNKTAGRPETATEKVGQLKAEQKPVPTPKEPVKLGFKSLRLFKHPVNLP